jgi:hypothetical protein
MKVYRRIVFDIVSGEVIESESFDYDGPLDLCDGGGAGGGGGDEGDTPGQGGTGGSGGNVAGGSPTPDGASKVDSGDPSSPSGFGGTLAGGGMGAGDAPADGSPGLSFADPDVAVDTTSLTTDNLAQALASKDAADQPTIGEMLNDFVDNYNMANSLAATMGMTSIVPGLIAGMVGLVASQAKGDETGQNLAGETTSGEGMQTPRSDAPVPAAPEPATSTTLANPEEAAMALLGLLGSGRHGDLMTGTSGLTSRPQTKRPTLLGG